MLKPIAPLWRKCLNTWAEGYFRQWDQDVSCPSSIAPESQSVSCASPMLESEGREDWFKSKGFQSRFFSQKTQNENYHSRGKASLSVEMLFLILQRDWSIINWAPVIPKKRFDAMNGNSKLEMVLQTAQRTSRAPHSISLAVCRHVEPTNLPKSKRSRNGYEIRHSKKRCSAWNHVVFQRVLWSGLTFLVDVQNFPHLWRGWEKQGFRKCTVFTSQRKTAICYHKVQRLLTSRDVFHSFLWC